MRGNHANLTAREDVLRQPLEELGGWDMLYREDHDLNPLPPEVYMCTLSSCTHASTCAHTLTCTHQKPLYQNHALNPLPPDV